MLFNLCVQELWRTQCQVKKEQLSLLTSGYMSVSLSYLIESVCRKIIWLISKVHKLIDEYSIEADIIYMGVPHNNVWLLGLVVRTRKNSAHLLSLANTPKSGQDINLVHCFTACHYGNACQTALSLLFHGQAYTNTLLSWPTYRLPPRSTHTSLLNFPEHAHWISETEDIHGTLFLLPAHRHHNGLISTMIMLLVGNFVSL